MNDNLIYKLSNIPHSTGVYIYKNKQSEVIYVGKAKDLYKRVHNYFDAKNHNIKTNKLVENIYDMDFIEVNNVNESLILENQLINKYKPKYNILLKYSSPYPYIVLTDEKNPRLIYTKDINKFHGKYYGPIANSDANKYEIYNLLLKLFPFRKCFTLKKHKCIYADIGQCLAPCVNKISPEQ
jgi:excinuclease ABC subunit C